MEPSSVSSSSIVQTPYTPTPDDAPVSPTNHSAAQAWLRLGVNPSRFHFAAESQARSPEKTRAGWIAIGVASALGSAAVSAVYLATATKVPAPGINFTGKTTYLDYTLFQAALNMVEQTIQGLVTPLFIALLLALFMQRALGTFNQRFDRALYPAILATVPVQVLSILLGAGTAIVTTAFIPALVELSSLNGKTDQASVARITELLPQVAAFSGLALLIAGIGVAYATVQYVQSGAVASNLNRWGVFGILILAYIAFQIAVSIVFYPLNLLLIR